MFLGHLTLPKCAQGGGRGVYRDSFGSQDACDSIYTKFAETTGRQSVIRIRGFSTLKLKLLQETIQELISIVDPPTTK